MSEYKAPYTVEARDISTKAISVGRTLDRLPEGEHTVRVSKNEDGTWTLKIISYARKIEKVLE